MSTSQASAFTHQASLPEVNSSVGEAVRRRVLDTLAAMTAGYRMPGIDVTRGYALDTHAGEAAPLLDGSGRRLSVAGATLANATAANMLDIDDGYREVKGHPAAVVVPAALAAGAATDATVGEVLDAVYVGYELAVRAGLAIHTTDGVYTGTGSWGAVGAAAAVARCRGLSQTVTAHSLGTAEYHAPRTPIMRGVSEPGMTKDGIGWGAYVGVAAANLAARGFTGSGTIFDEADLTPTATLGEHHHVTHGYLKPYPCCRWAQPGVDAVLALRENRDIDPDAVDEIRVQTFAEATQLETRHPETIEAAEYSYPFPVAVALARGRLTPVELLTFAKDSPTIEQLADIVELTVTEEIDDRFPSECLARVELVIGTNSYTSSITRPRGARERPLSPARQREKVEQLCSPTLDVTAIDQVKQLLSDRNANVTEVLALWD